MTPDRDAPRPDARQHDARQHDAPRPDNQIRPRLDPHPDTPEPDAPAHGAPRPRMARPDGWLTRQWRKLAPSREALEGNKYIAPFAHRVLAPELWRFTRRSVPRGVALGILVGIIVPAAQIVICALLAFSVRANVPLAAAMTFITNPVTTPLIWVAAYKVGQFVLRVNSSEAGQAVQAHVQNGAVGGWMTWLTGAMFDTALGLFIIATVSATLGYLFSSWGWGWWIRHQRAQRHAHRTI